VRTRHVWNVSILLCCLAPSSVLAASGVAPGYAETIPTPMPEGQMATTVSGGEVESGSAYPPRALPWYYWWLAYHGRGQHYAYLPPLPGSYYLRPYSLSQLEVQQKGVLEWGGDPRNPYSNVEFRRVNQKQSRRIYYGR
jgi:hypothetical protein